MRTRARSAGRGVRRGSSRAGPATPPGRAGRRRRRGHRGPRSSPALAAYQRYRFSGSDARSPSSRRSGGAPPPRGARPARAARPRARRAGHRWSASSGRVGRGRASARSWSRRARPAGRGPPHLARTTVEPSSSATFPAACRLPDRLAEGVDRGGEVTGGPGREAEEAGAAPRAKWSAGPARSRARRACATVPAMSPRACATDARYTAIMRAAPQLPPGRGPRRRGDRRAAAVRTRAGTEPGRRGRAMLRAARSPSESLADTICRRGAGAGAPLVGGGVRASPAGSGPGGADAGPGQGELEQVGRLLAAPAARAWANGVGEAARAGRASRPAAGAAPGADPGARPGAGRAARRRRGGGSGTTAAGRRADDEQVGRAPAPPAAAARPAAR